MLKLVFIVAIGAAYKNKMSPACCSTWGGSDDSTLELKKVGCLLIPTSEASDFFLGFISILLSTEN